MPHEKIAWAFLVLVSFALLAWLLVDIIRNRDQDQDQDQDKEQYQEEEKKEEEVKNKPLNARNSEAAIQRLKGIIKSACRRRKRNPSSSSKEEVVDGGGESPLESVCDSIADIPITEDGQSYTINKQEIYLCLRDEKNRVYYNDNMLVYVLLHELSHVLCKSIGHTEEFHAIFDQLLQEAVAEGIYNDSEPPSEDYCKVKPHLQ